MRTASVCVCIGVYIQLIVVASKIACAMTFPTLCVGDPGDVVVVVFFFVLRCVVSCCALYALIRPIVACVMTDTALEKLTFIPADTFARVSGTFCSLT